MRAFLALPLDATAHSALASTLRTLQRASWAREVRWVAEENLHLTVRFLGDVSEARQARLRAALSTHLREANLPSALHLHVSAPSLFPTGRRPRVVACLVETNAALLTLAAIAEHCAQAVGLPAETKPFQPHITLGRLRDGAALPSLRSTPIALSMCADQLCLYRSTLTPKGAIYTPEWTCAWAAC